MLISTMQETSTNTGPQRNMCLHCPKHQKHIVPSTGQLALYSTVYCSIVYYGGRVYGHDRGYKGGNLALRVA